MCQAGRNRLDDTRLALQENNAHLPARDTTCTNDGINHLGFRIEGMDAPVDRMAAAGYRPTPASALDGHAYRRRAPFKDGNGFEWALIEYPSEPLSERNRYDRYPSGAVARVSPAF